MSTTVTLGQSSFTGTDHRAIQNAIDHVASHGGGTVIFPAGEYRLRNAIRLRSNVELRGEPGAVLRCEPGAKTSVLDYLGYGFTEFRVAEPQLFTVGDGVLIQDRHSPGFYSTVGTIVEQNDDTFLIDRAFNHDYLPHQGAEAVRSHSIIEIHGVENASVRNLTLDGNREQTIVINGCRAGAIFMLQSKGVTIENVTIERFNGDALSFQQCTRITVRNNTIHHCSGGGLHPGSGSFDYLLEDNLVHDNAGSGLFYCLRTTHSIARNNRLLNNGQNGISIGERDTDHLITKNIITGNHGVGVEWREVLARGGDRIQLLDNEISDNAKAQPDQPEILVSANTRDVVIAGNRITNPARKPVVVEAGAQRIAVVDNAVNNHAQTPGDVHAAAGTAPTDVNALRTELQQLHARGSDGRHLGWK